MGDAAARSEVFTQLAGELIQHGRSFRFQARGRSMLPTIADGDFLHVEPVERIRLKRGDVVLFTRKNQLKAHRIIARQGDSWLTRGDASTEIDGVIGREQIMGRVFAKECHESGVVVRLAGARARTKFLANEWRRRLVAALALAVSLMTVLAILPTAARAQGGIPLDGTPQAGQATVNCASSCTQAFSLASTTVTSGLTNPVLFVGFSLQLNGNGGSALRGPGCVDGTLPSFGGAALAGPDVSLVNGNEYAAIYHLVNPPAGSAHTVDFCVSKSNNNNMGVVVGTVSLYKVKTTAPVTATGTHLSPSSADPTVIVNGGVHCDAVFGTFSAPGNTLVTAVGTGEVQAWSLASGTSKSTDSYGFASLKGGASSSTLAETLNGNAKWAFVAVDVAAQTPCSVTAARVNSFAATAGRGGSLLTWSSGGEMHNLGYNVYRDVAGAKTRVNSSLIAGSALLMRESLEQHGAKGYSFVDKNPVAGAVYWLEDVDLNGQTTMHGPIMPSANIKASFSLPSNGRSADLATSQSAVKMLSPAGGAEAHVRETVIRPKPSALSKSLGFALAARPAVKVLVDHEGWYRVTQPQLVVVGLSPNINSDRLHLYAEGVEQPIAVTGGGIFGPQSAIEFYGTAIDTPYSGQRVYWLTTGNGPALRIRGVAGNGTPGPQAQTFIETLELKPRTTYFAALLREDTDNFFGSLVAPGGDVESLNVSNLASGNTKLSVVLQGVTEGQQHDVTVVLNGATLGDVTFSGQQEGSASFDVPPGIVGNGTNTVTLTAQQGSNDISLLDKISLSFPHTFTAESDQLKFTANAGDSVAVGGFVQSPSRVIDVTDPLHPLELKYSITSSLGVYSLQTQVPWTAAGMHNLLALSDVQLGTPFAIVPHHPSTLHASQSGGEFVIVTTPQFAPAFESLAFLHTGEGKTVAIVAINDIYDEFNFGEPSPYAVKAFLRTATSAWKSTPKYLVLGGDASVDPRNYLGFGFLDFVPTKIVATAMLKTASDDWFSDFSGNGMATIATGRMPARTLSDAQVMTGKILSYAAGGQSGWNTHTLMVADQNDPLLSFTSAAQTIETVLPPFISNAEVFAGTLGVPAARQTLIDDLNNGQLLVNYTGHGSVQVWSGSTLFDDSDAASLANGKKLPVFVAMNCLNGFFHDVYTQSLAEALMLAPNGGAVGVWASSGLTQPEPQFQMDKSFVQRLFSQGTTIGDAAMQAKATISDLDVRRTFILFGDPAMRLSAAVLGAQSGLRPSPAQMRLKKPQ